MSAHFYCYTHCRPNGIPFYVGKGTGNRAYHIADRNAYHSNIVRKYGKDNISVNLYPCSSESASLSLERVLIKFLRGRHLGLTNVLNGGEAGASGSKNPAKRLDVRIKMRESAAVAVSEGRHNCVANPPLRNPATAKRVSEDHRKRLEGGTHHLLTNNPAKTAENRQKKRMSWSGSGNPMKNPEVVAKRINPSHVPEVVMRRADKLRGRICVNNGVKYIRVHPEEVQGYLDAGWEKGRLCQNP